MHKYQLGYLKANLYDVKSEPVHFLTFKRHNCILILPIAGMQKPFYIYQQDQLVSNDNYTCRSKLLKTLAPLSQDSKSSIHGNGQASVTVFAFKECIVNI